MGVLNGSRIATDSPSLIIGFLQRRPSIGWARRRSSVRSGRSAKDNILSGQLPFNHAVMGMPKPMIISRCSECGESINRYTLKTLTSLFRIQGGFYTHKCNICKTTYAPSTIILLVTIFALGQIDIRETNLNIVVVVLLIVSGFVLSVAYLLPLSVFCKPDDNQN